MPRKARVLVPECPHHIVQRGHNRQVVFIEERDYQYYLDNLKEFKEELGIKVYAWCLMTNHIHLILEPGDDVSVISKLMKRLAGRQSAYVNKLERRTGSLWEGRYKSSPIQKDEYLLPCVRYVEMNPVRANMVADPLEYLWSSCMERLEGTKREMLDFDPAYLSLGNSPSERIDRYQRYLLNGTSDMEMELIRQSVKRNQLTGNNRFVDQVEKRIGIRVEMRGRGRPVLEK